jgi:outer membrane receptor protein involved in Fe transport
MPGQADHLANLALGYEKGGFTGRISMVYQGSSLSFVGQRAELDGYTDAFLRLDLALQQKLTPTISMFLNVNNVTSRPEASYLGIRDFPTAEEYFGLTADVGVRVSF